jgi:hypothetical protein
LFTRHGFAGKRGGCGTGAHVLQADARRAGFAALATTYRFTTTGIALHSASQHSDS